jgi:hypothetical protein
MVLFVACIPAARGFSLLGPPIDGDAWQVPAIDYMIGNDVGGPKNIGEGYRRNTPVLFYTYDANFLGFFGTYGAAQGDKAFAILNNVFSNNITGPVGLDGYSPDLLEFPFYSEGVNYTAQSLGLTDLKSVIIGSMMEELGLADPVRYVWTLRSRTAGADCPLTTTYDVIQRNFDIIPSPLSSLTAQTQYSSYVNDVLYSYQIFEDCAGVPTAGTIPIPVDPFALTYAPVASFPTTFIDYGYFYNGLTRDDVAGLRYLLSSNNIATEDPATGALLLVTNTLPDQLLTTLPISLLSQAQTTDDPATLQAAYPTLTFVSVITNYVTNVAPTITAYYTNQPYFAGPGTNGTTVTNWGWPPQFLYTANYGLLMQEALTNDPVDLMALYPGLVVTTTTNYAEFYQTNLVLTFTNQPGADVTNFTWPPEFQPTADLGLLIQEARTNDPADLVALYPGLVVTTTTNWNDVILTNLVLAYTNQPGPDVTNFDVEQVLNPPPGNNVPPPPGQTEWAGTMDFGLFTLQVLTNTTGIAVNIPLAEEQLQALYPGLVIVDASYYFTNVVTTNFVTKQVVPYGEPYPGVPINVTYVGSVVTNRIVRYNYDFGNVMLDVNNTFVPFVNYTNSKGLYSPLRTVTVQTTILAPPIGSPYGSPPATNVTTKVETINSVAGDFFIMPTNWCGFQLDNAEYPPIPTVISNYSVLVSAGYTNGTTGNLVQLYATNVNVVYSYTNVQFIIQPGICEPVETNYYTYTTNLVLTYSNILYNVYTNTYSPNSYVTLVTTNISVVPGGNAVTLATNITSVSLYTNIPTGDFFLIPTNWCGFNILAVTNGNIVPGSNTVVAVIPAGVADVGQVYSLTTYSEYTNHDLVIQPGVCEPVTNIYYTTISNLVLTYSNTLYNVYNMTNYYYPNNLYADYSSNSYITQIYTNISVVPGGNTGTLVTNVWTNIVVLTNIPTDDFFIIPTNWCGFQILAVTNGDTVTATTTTVATVPPGVADVGEAFSITTISSYTNHELAIQPGVCEPVLQFGTNYTTNIVATYQYDFGNVVTLTSTNVSPVTILTTNVYVVAWGDAVTLATNITEATVLTNISTGEFFILPPAWCGYTILTNQASLTTVTYTTNLIYSVTANTFGISGGGVTFDTTGGGVVTPAPASSNVLYTLTAISSYTNHTYLVQAQTCETVADGPRLRQGIESIQFVRADYDSLLSQTFRPVTNNYTMTAISNSLPFTQFFQRVVTAPDILLTAEDTLPNPTAIYFSDPVWDEANILPGLAGPGTINPPIKFTLDKAGPVYENDWEILDLNPLITAIGETNQTLLFVWASFDASTNDPVVYPSGASITNLINQVTIRISPATLPAGASGAAYGPVTFTTTGGGAFEPPFTWSWAPVAGETLPPGTMTLVSNPDSTATLSGTPSQSGTFDFILQLTDHLGRSVSWNYSITIN